MVGINHRNSEHHLLLLEKIVSYLDMAFVNKRGLIKLLIHPSEVETKTEIEVGDYVRDKVSASWQPSCVHVCVMHPLHGLISTECVNNDDPVGLHMFHAGKYFFSMNVMYNGPSSYNTYNII